MIITEKKYPLNAFRICIDRIEGNVEGRVFSPLQKECIFFADMGDVLVKMDELFDKVGYPQAFQDKRSFGDGRERFNLYQGVPKGELSAAKIVLQAGKYRTFDIVVNSRKNTSWQGSIYVENGMFLSDFDGEIELLTKIIQ